jgi:hypothetical protein
MFRQITTLFLIALALPAIAIVSASAATLEITGPPGASLIINDQDMGFFPLDGPLDLPSGVYTLKSQLPGYKNYEHSLKLVGDKDWERLAVRMVPYSRKTAWTSNILFAGLGQHYLDKNFRGYVYNAAEAGGLLVAIIAELDRSNLSKDYLELEDQYNSSINADDITRYREAADETYSDMEDAEKMRNTGLLVAGGAIVVSIIDAIVFFPHVEAGAGHVPLNTGALDDGILNTGPWASSATALHASVKLEF